MKVGFKDILGATVSWTFNAVIRVVAIVLGYVMVPLGLMFTKLPDTDATEHELIRLPIWCHPWDNIRDGAMGDKRLWYWLTGYPKVIDKLPRKWQPFCKSFHWLAIRNSANTLSRYYPGIGCPVDKCKIEYTGQYLVKDEFGKEGFQFVRAKGPYFTYYGLYHNIPLPQKGWFKGRALIGRMGHKVEPRHMNTDWSQEEPTKAYKGWTFRPYLPQRQRYPD